MFLIYMRCSAASLYAAHAHSHPFVRTCYKHHKTSRFGPQCPGFHLHPLCLPCLPGVPAFLHGLLHHLQSGDSVSSDTRLHSVISHLTLLPATQRATHSTAVLTICPHCTSCKAPLTPGLNPPLMISRYFMCAYLDHTF